MRKNALHILYHISVVLASAGMALSLPAAIKYVPEKVLSYWSLIENDELFTLSTEIIVAVVLIVLIHALGRSWRSNTFSRMAKTAGIVMVAPERSFLAQRQVKRLKAKQGSGKSVMIISSTGSRTFGARGDLRQVLVNCREARIMLLDPRGQGVIARAKSLADPGVTPEVFREQILGSIEFLKFLKAIQKNIRLKLYPDVPLMELAILGDYLFLQHYPTGLNVRRMPEFVFKHDSDSSLFSLFYHSFVSRWIDPNIPEYDLDADELVYRDRSGSEVKREKFNESVIPYERP